MIDATDPAVIDVRTFRRAGESKRIERSITAGPGLGAAAMGVPEGAPIELDVLLESVIDGVLVTGSLSYPVTGECSRCLDPLVEQRSADFSDLFLWEEPEEIDPQVDPLPLVTDGYVDLRDLVHDAVVLELPLAPLCSEDCRGLCETCGIRLADAPADHAHEILDPRWAALEGLAADLSGEPAAGADEGMGNT